MYIKSIVIDGFKSYGKRTEVKDFDPEFNAITGLNGSGKSNILDSICFVLGITNLSQVRAGSLQELVYKSGQAGITKASVTVTFDNRDRNKSPIGYDRYEEITITRQIVVGGKNKYMINGSTVQNKKVNDLFNSVQLNVNNPHFLIMQGRITKVLSMKPPEILSMIEEAAGTRMYENKKQAAEKTIEKKDAKLNEMNKLICEEIAPKLGRLKDEQSKYLELQKVTRELDHLFKIHTAYRYLHAEESAVKSEEELINYQQSINDKKRSIEDGKAQITEIEQQILDVQKKRDEEKGGILAETEKKLNIVEGNQAKLVAKLKSSKDNVSAEERRKKHLEKSLKDDQDALSDKQKHLDKMKDIFEQLKTADQEDSEALAAAQRRYQAVSAGLIASDDTGDATFQDLLMKAKQEVAQMQTEKKQCAMQLDYNERELKTKEKQLKQTEVDFAKEQKQLAFKEKEFNDIQNELSNINYEDGKIEKLTEEKRSFAINIRMLQDKISNVESRNYRLAFRYIDPEPNFNHSLVKGLVCKLFKVKDRRFCTALETAAGERLYNVVVANDDVSRKLIKYGQLESRTTFIPLNKIASNKMDNRIVNLAAQLVGSDNIFPALSLIEYDNQLQPAMQWLFGQLFVCTDMDSGMKVAFDKRIMRRCITLDGDVIDPMGTLSGGAQLRTSSILNVVSELCKMQTELEHTEEKLRRVNSEIQSLSRIASNYSDLKQRLELRQHELEMIRERLQQTAHHQYQQEVDSLKQNIIDLKQKIDQCSLKEKENLKKVNELEGKVKNAKAIRDKELKTAEAEMNRIKKKAETSRKQWKEREQECENLNLEVAELQNSITNGQEQIVDASKKLDELKQESSDIAEELSNIKIEIKELQSDIAAQKAIISKHDHEIITTTQKKEKIAKEVADAELACITLEHSITKMKSDAEDAKKRLVDMESRYEWIKSDRQFFGEPNGMYDFKEHDPKEAGRKLKVLEETKEKLSRTVNTRAMNLLGKEEEEYNEMIRKKTIVENDKAKIVAVIKQLDEKKKDALRAAWEKVNKDFGSIFSSLLPGAQAMLKPPDGKDLLDGLEVKVGFGGIWKESLGELSGGQRSLVALSLILSMLLFNPAPIYILDEVDAALDLSHTQNIGQMLKAHFKHSQFIIVSLKDGMFNNANVLFRTRFVDGMSTVIRTTPDSN
ncbi:structural maintenance of chromosomes 2 [Lycorma delicatula]|uniref:structural maintenance of chromosomes 2 n=1 Tax=Lycorma delicatula TaxID=130591 RepID=UPI003F515F04